MVMLQRAMHHNLSIQNIAAVDTSPHHILTQVNAGQDIVSIREKQSLTTFTVHGVLFVMNAVLPCILSRSAPYGSAGNALISFGEDFEARKDSARERLM
jgi:hypothetical protein